MGANGLDEYMVPKHVKDHLRKLGFVLPLDDMEPWLPSWNDWMSARGDYCDNREKGGMRRVAIKELGERIGKCSNLYARTLKSLAGMEILEWHGCGTHDPSQRYTLAR